MIFLLILILINQGSVWDGFGYILTIILFSILYNVTKFFEFKTKYSLCAEVKISMIVVIEPTALHHHGHLNHLHIHHHLDHLHDHDQDGHLPGASHC